MNAMIIAPSLLSADFGFLNRDVVAVTQAGADWIHVDVMDGHFVPNITMGANVIQAVRRATSLPIDAHLMIENPDLHLEAFIKAGATHVSVHVETGYHLDRTLRLIRSLGAVAGVALNPGTPIEAVFPVLSLVDYVLVMTVNPGFSGQQYIESAEIKIKTLANHLASRSLSVQIQVDGGVDAGKIKKLRDLGVMNFVAGHAIFKAGSIAQAILEMRKNYAS